MQQCVGRTVFYILMVAVEVTGPITYAEYFVMVICQPRFLSENSYMGLNKFINCVCILLTYVLLNNLKKTRSNINSLFAVTFSVAI